ncbi:MAG: hypothetical protein JO332_15495, partial [Planctomycetaceae bacterium]|nr:hypothetical protein [Planctomycetaceae bacterium]
MSLIRIPPRLNLLAICGLGALGLGATGQGGLLCPWAREHHLVWALLALLLIPLLLVWFGNFTKVSPLSAAANG